MELFTFCLLRHFPSMQDSSLPSFAFCVSFTKPLITIGIKGCSQTVLHFPLIRRCIHPIHLETPPLSTSPAPSPRPNSPGCSTSFSPGTVHCRSVIETLGLGSVTNFLSIVLWRSEQICVQSVTRAHFDSL